MRKIASSIYVYGFAWLVGAMSASVLAATADQNTSQVVAEADTPDLKEINRSVLESETIDLNQKAHRPSFMLRESDGTEIREYRERDKPVEIEVRSSLGTYEMTSPNGKFKVDSPNERRLPTVKLLNF